MRYKISLEGKDYIVEVEEGEVIMVDVHDTPTPAPVAPTLAATPQAAVPAPAATAQAASPAPVEGQGEAVPAPMNGLILSVNVQPGTQVKAGDTLCILEAMKMENEITSPKDGLVSHIVIEKGSHVETGQTLLFLE